ncbi:MFS transporter, partial [Bacteroides thetaiotaomicron]|nr:MFS transporter [Bacteroides thetaiotaomicron]
TSKFTSSCDIAKSALAKAGLNYENVAAPAGTLAEIKVGDTVIQTYDGKATDAKAQGAAFDKTLASTLKGAGYPAKADPAQLNWPMTIVILT